MAILANGERGWRGFAASSALVATATGLGSIARAQLSAPDLTMLYLLVVVTAAARYGRAPSLLASALSVLAYNFFFVPPLHTFRVAESRHLLTFATMFVVSLLISALTSRIREQEHEAAEREQRTRAAEMRANTEQMRSSLLSAVSHDLRTPLGAITGAATTLRDTSSALDEPQRAELLDTICEEAERMERFVVNLLEMTRLQSGALEVRREWVPLEEWVGAALGRAERQLMHHRVEVRVAPDLPWIPVDPVLMEQVLFNLLDNASKYAPPDTVVEISASASGHEVTLEVSDRGPGLEPGTELQIFEKFYRSPHHAVRGAGLGLAICRGIVEAHGGGITATRRDGGGARFTVVLPLLGEPPGVPEELNEAAEGAHG